MNRKKKWIWGPEVPQDFPRTRFCSTALNSSAVIFLGGASEFGEFQHLPFLYDLSTKKWDRGPSIKHCTGYYNHYFDSCSATLFFNKYAKKKVMVLFKSISEYNFSNY